MKSSMRDHTSGWSKVLLAVRDYHNDLEENGEIDPAKIKLSLIRSARPAHAKRLADAGMTQRQIAKELGVSVSTINNDLAVQNRTKKTENVEEISSIPVQNRTTEDTTEEQTELEQAQKREAALREQLKIAQAPVVVPEKRYGTIVIDPPWPMKKIEREVRPNQVEFDYPTMDYEALRAWRATFRGLVAGDCHVFMWTTQKFLPMALRLFEDYEVKYVLTMVWHKPGGFQPIGLPQYNCEFVIYGRVGAPKFIDTKAFNCCFEAARAEHSRKPDEFYDLVRRVTDGDRIDIFSRESREGFDQLGNEISKFEAA